MTWIIPENECACSISILNSLKEEEELMKTTSIAAIAEELLAAHGDKAEAEAAQKALQSEQAGNPADASDWKKVRAAISQMRGSKVS